MSGSFIAFTDGIGSAQLDNGTTGVAAAVGSRFSNWVSESLPVGDSAVSLGTGARSMFVFRTDYKATFDLLDIPNANVVVLDRLIAWLLGGGTCSVTLNDVSAHVYTTCCLAEGTTPVKKMHNKNDITWQLSLSLVNLASATPMTADYSS